MDTKIIKTDYDIAKATKLLPIETVAAKIGIKKGELEQYGKYIAKVDAEKLLLKHKKKPAKLVLVTAMHAGKFGEGKTTVSIGLADSLNLFDKQIRTQTKKQTQFFSNLNTGFKVKTKAVLALREPSLGPVFGTKGGATGGGKSQVLPMEPINLHFTGDFHAITSANNLLSAIIDSHIFNKNELDIKDVVFNRCIDINDRALRNITLSETKNKQGVSTGGRKDGFVLTAASEVMGCLLLAENLEDLKTRLGNILVGFNSKGSPIFAKNLKAEDAMTILLKDALKPNLVQSIAGTPAFLHAGPFANISFGVNSLNATRLAINYGDYAITEAGFAADLGAQKFLEIMAKNHDLVPDCVVVVATIRALLHQGDGDVDLGLNNLKRHIENLQNYGLKVVIALNKFKDDKKDDILKVKHFCENFAFQIITPYNNTGLNVISSSPFEHGIPFAIFEGHGKGASGGLDLAKKVITICENQKHKQNLPYENNALMPKLNFVYNNDNSPKTKIEKIATKIYRAKNVVFNELAKQKLKQIETLAISGDIVGINSFDIVMAKTQSSFSGDAKLLNAPENFTLEVDDIEIKTGIKALVVICGGQMLMPGLTKTAAYLNMQIDNHGNVEGLF